MEWRVEHGQAGFVWLPSRQTAINLDHIVGVEFSGPHTTVITTRQGGSWGSLAIYCTDDVAALRDALGLAVKS
jgi:hypothetical protein